MVRRRLTRAESQEETRQTLLDAGEELFCEQGLHRTTVSQIAAAAGFTAGAVYSNFANKEELALGVLTRSVQQTYQALADTLAATPDIADRMVAVIDWRRRLLAEREPTGVLRLELALHAHRDEALRAQLGAAQQQLREAFADLLRQQADDVGGTLQVEPVLLSATMLSVADGTAIAAALEPDGPYAESFAWLLANLVRWIEPSPVPPDDWPALVARLTAAARPASA